MNYKKNEYKHPLSKEELRIERTRYDLLVNNNLMSMDFNEDIYKQIRNFIYFTVILGGTFCWASASSESNIYIFLTKYFSLESTKLLVFIIIFLLLVMVFVGSLISMYNTKRMILAGSLLMFQKQNDIFKEFIKMRLKIEEKTDIESMEQLLKVIQKKDIYDIIFNEIDFENFVLNHLSRYKYNFPLGFYKNYVNLILYNQCIESVLIQTQNSYNSEYVLIIDNNYTLL